jgi:hypothetical protein
MMAPAKSDVTGLGGGPQRPAFGPAIWAWGPACGLVLWLAGFLILPWWAAVFLWWWPSLLFGAALGLATIGFAKLLSRAIGARGRAARNLGSTGLPSGSETHAAVEPLSRRQAAATPPATPRSTPSASGDCPIG